MSPLDLRIADSAAPAVADTSFVPADQNGHAPHRYESIPRPSRTATETMLIGIAMVGDFAALLTAINEYRISVDSFHLASHGLAFTAACDQRVASDDATAPAAPGLVWARLDEQAEAEGATRAYGVSAGQLAGWASAAMPVWLDFYAWTLAEYAHDRAVRGVYATAVGRLGETRDAGAVARWTVTELTRLDAEHTGARGTSATGLSRGQEEAFWTARPSLARVRQFARSRMASPWATLGCVVVRVVAQVGPEFVLPKIIGTYASLNTYVSVVAPSGIGKDAAMDTAEDAYTLGPVSLWPVGTGEGVVKHFVHFEADGNGGGKIVQHETSIIVDVSEVEQIAAIKNRQGSTLMAVLRATWTGKPFGFGNAELERRLRVGRHAYRLGVIVGVQPDLAGALLNDTEIAGGTPQRFLWFPGVDSDMPDVEPAEPGEAFWSMPPWPDDVPFTAGMHVLDVWPGAVAEIRAAHRARHANPAAARDTALDGHLLLCRLKAAAGLGLLAGHVRVTEEDWHLAGVLMQVSNHTRGLLVEARSNAEASVVRKRAESYAVGRVVAEDRMESERLRRTKNAILSRLEKLRAERGSNAWMAGSDLFRSLKAQTQRPYFDDVMPGLVSTGQVEAEPTESEGTSGMRYRLPVAAPLST